MEALFSRQKHGSENTNKVEKKAGIWIVIGVLLVMWLSGVMFPGDSVYQSIVWRGYDGTQEQWLASLVGEEADPVGAETAYELAVENGYAGTETEWLEALTGVTVEQIENTPYAIACEHGFEGSLSEWLTDLADQPEQLGRTKEGGQKTPYDLACEYGYSGTFIEWLVSVTHDHVFE